MIAILQCLKKYGQRLDLEIAVELSVSLATVRQRLTRLTASGKVITYSVARFENVWRIDALQCRVAGFVPPSGPGRKPKTTA